MRVLFLGYGKVGYLCLKCLIDRGIEVSGVVPRATDTGKEENNFSVRALAYSLNIPICSHADARKPKPSAALLVVDYLFSVQYDKILKKDWLSIPRLDTLNLHFSHLPKLRGCFPTKWAIIEEKFSGVTLHSVDEGIDTGPILDQRKVHLDERETDASLYMKLSKCAVKLFEENISHIKKGHFPNRKNQVDSESSYHPKELPYNGILALDKGIIFCDRFLRAFDFHPFPPATCRLAQFDYQELGLFSPIYIAKSNEVKAGFSKFTEDNLLKVHSSDGFLFFDKVLYKQQVLNIPELKNLT